MNNFLLENKRVNILTGLDRELKTLSNTFAYKSLKFFEKRLNWVFQIKDIGFSFQITEGSYILIDI